ncbi:Dbl homology domain-containing protein [Aspergillus filifer]
MDPLSISASVAGLTASCVQTAKALHDLKDKFDNTNLTISAICTETTLIFTSMSHIQSRILQDPSSVSAKLQNQSSLESTLDQSLTSCYIVFDVLQTELSKLTESQLSNYSGSLELGWGTMKDILGQMRGLQSALTLLIQLLGAGKLIFGLLLSDTVSELRQTIDQNTAILSEVAQHTSRITANRASRAPKSVFDMSFETRSISGESDSVYSSKLFAFDDQVVNSTAYRQVLAKAYARESSTTSPASGDDKNEINSERVTSQEEETRSTSDPKKLVYDPLKEFLDKRNCSFKFWVDHWSLKPYHFISVSKQEVTRRTIIQYLYYHRLTFDSSVTISGSSNEEFAAMNFGFYEGLRVLHSKLLLEPLLKLQARGPWVIIYWDFFQHWLEEASGMYRDFSGLFPHLCATVSNEATKNASFANFLAQSREHPSNVKLPCTTCMESPMARLQRYPLLLAQVLKYSDPSDERHEYQQLESLIEDINHLLLECNEEAEKASRRETTIDLWPQLTPESFIPTTHSI